MPSLDVRQNNPLDKAKQQKIKISNGLKGDKNPNYGKPAHNRGKSPSPETIEKRRIGMKKAWVRRKLEIIKNSQTPMLVPVFSAETQIPPD